jgi:hypothetical protein
MEEPEFSCSILSKLNLDDIEKVVKRAYHKEDSLGAEIAAGHLQSTHTSRTET